VLHEHVVIMATETLPVPRVPPAHRIEVDNLGHAGHGIVHVSARLGYTETPDIPATLRLLDPAQTEGPISIDEASYFLSKMELKKGPARCACRLMRPWWWKALRLFDLDSDREWASESIAAGV
jgi:KUP system potassium uptake protein